VEETCRTVRQQLEEKVDLLATERDRTAKLELDSTKAEHYHQELLQHLKETRQLLTDTANSVNLRDSEAAASTEAM
jgi:hypothetical protein